MPDISELVGQLGLEAEAAFKAGFEVWRAVTRATAPGQEAARAELAAQLAAELNARTPSEKDAQGREIGLKLVHPPAGRNRICRLLSYVAGAQQVPALVEALGDYDVREAARCALEANPSEEATDALIAALGRVGPTFRVGVVGALARRRGAKVLAALQNAAANDEDLPVRIAAVEALGEFPDLSSAAIIEKAAASECAPCRARAHRVHVRLAETLRKAGKKNPAAGLYKAVLASEAGEAQKKAARIGLKALGV